MNNYKKKIRVITVLTFILFSIVFFNACEVSSTGSITNGDLTVHYDDVDLDATWDLAKVTAIQLNGNAINCDSDSVTVDGSTATILSAGTYVLGGTLTDGQIIINTVENEPVRLVLNGVDIACFDSSAIYASKAEKVVLVLAEDTENRVTDSSQYVFADNETDEPSAAIFCKGDLTINGDGTLTVDANYKEGITSKDELKIVSGNISVDAVEDGIRGRDFVAIKEGTVTINAGADGIKSNNDEDEDLGFVLIENGTIAIVSCEDGIQGENKVSIENGNIQILSGGGSENGISYGNNGSNESFGSGSRMNSGNSNTITDTDPTANTSAVTSSMNMINISTTSSDSSLIMTGSISDDTTIQGKGTPPQGGGGMPPGGAETDGKTSTPPTGDPPSGDDGSGAPPEGVTPPEAAGKTDNAQADADSVTTDTTEKATDTTTTTSDDISMKGIKAGVDISISGGTIEINSADDAIHSNDSISISGGSVILSSGDDGIHSDASMTIGGGTIDISTSYEGIESATIIINDGNISIISSDDSINVAGGDDGSSLNGRPGQNNFQSDGANQLVINDGYIVVQAAGDGVDSNGSIEMNEGTLIVNGPTSSGNGALDYMGSFKLTGGYLVAVGSSGMAQTASETSTQNSVMIQFDSTMSAGTLVHIESESKEDILTFAPSKQYQTVVFASSELKEGETYLIYTGGSYDGTQTDGMYCEGSYTDGTEYYSFTVSGTITEVGSSTNQGQMGGGYKKGVKQQRDNQTTDEQTKIITTQ